MEASASFDYGPGKASYGFYNRAMEVSRDMTVALLQTAEPGLALDGMAGIGIRGIRIARETKWKVVLNDRDRRNKDIMLRNAESNNANVEILSQDFLCSASSRKWDYIDLDPFGSPAGMVEGAILNLRDRGILGISMTDTANLEGKSIGKGARIYGSRSMKGEYSRELSTRIFIKYVLERGASLGRAGKVLLSVRDSHYIRLFIQFKKGNKISDKVQSLFSTINLNGEMVGPLYMGNLYDQETIAKMQDFSFSKLSRKIFDNFKNEDITFLFQMNDLLGREIRASKIVESIISTGHKAGRTNFNQKGIKTDLGTSEYTEILSSL